MPVCATPWNDQSQKSQGPRRAGRPHKDFSLAIVNLPPAEPEAYWVTPSKGFKYAPKAQKTIFSDSVDLYEYHPFLDSEYIP